MASSERTAVARTTETDVGHPDAPVDDDVVVTAELPPAASRRRHGRRAARHNDTEGDPTEHAPLFAPPRRPGRRVVRIVRHIQLWSVFKVVLLGGLVLYGVFLLALVFGWSLANATGQVHHIEKFMRDIGFDNWSFNGPQLMRGAALAGAVLLLSTSIFITLWVAVINLIAELTGGLRFTVIETDETDDDEDDEDDR